MINITKDESKTILEALNFGIKKLKNIIKVNSEFNAFNKDYQELLISNWEKEIYKMKTNKLSTF